MEAEEFGFDLGRLAQANQFRCPGCASIVYSRKSKWCGVCGGTLPANFLFSQTEAARVSSTLRRERLLHREWLFKHEDQGWNLMPRQ